MSFDANSIVIYAKKESTYGTDAAPDTSNAVFGLIERPEITPEIMENTNEEISAGYNEKLSGAAVGSHWNIKMSFYLRGSGTNTASATDPPSIDPLLQACGLAYASQVYTPDSSIEPSATVWIHLDGKRYKAPGSRFTFDLSVREDRKVIITFTGKGLYVEPDDSALPSVTDAEAVPIVAKSCAFSIGTVSSSEMIATNFEFNLGNDIAVDGDLNSATGVKEIIVTGRKTRIKTNPRMTATSAHNLYSELISGTSGALSILFGQATDNKFTLAATTQWLGAPLGERNGKWVHEGLELKVASNTDDGDWTLTLS